MDVITVTVKKAFPYRGCDLHPGAIVPMDRIDAIFYQRYGFVGLTLPQTYQTRALVADHG